MFAMAQKRIVEVYCPLMFKRKHVHQNGSNEFQRGAHQPTAAEQALIGAYSRKNYDTSCYLRALVFLECAPSEWRQDAPLTTLLHSEYWIVLCSV